MAGPAWSPWARIIDQHTYLWQPTTAASRPIIAKVVGKTWAIRNHHGHLLFWPRPSSRSGGHERIAAMTAVPASADRKGNPYKWTLQSRPERTVISPRQGDELRERFEMYLHQHRRPFARWLCWSWHTMAYLVQNQAYLNSWFESMFTLRHLPTSKAGLPATTHRSKDQLCWSPLRARAPSALGEMCCNYKRSMCVCGRNGQAIVCSNCE